MDEAEQDEDHRKVVVKPPGKKRGRAGKAGAAKKRRRISAAEEEERRVVKKSKTKLMRQRRVLIPTKGVGGIPRACEDCDIVGRLHLCGYCANEWHFECLPPEHQALVSGTFWKC